MKHLILFYILLLPGFSHAATYAELDQACEAARDSLLQPEREAKITQCIADGKGKAYCERFYKTYGDASGSALSDNYTGRKYDSLPECEAAREARTSYRAGSDRTNNRDSDPSRTNYR